MRRGCATVLAVNKCDAAQPDFDELRGIARRKLRQRPRVLPVSALTGEGLDPLLLLVADLQSRYTAHIPTPPLNRLLGEITGRRAMPGRGRKRLKTYFVVQHATTPPRFVVDVNDRSLVTRDFGFFVENCIRETFALDGVPVIIEFKEK
jgi:GTP-binding protein